MKSYTWVSVLLVLMFLIGWTTRLVAERAGDDPAGPPRSSWFGGKSHWGVPGGSHHSGPFLDTVEQYREELSLTEAQQAELKELVEETARRVREQEQAIWEIKNETRQRVQQLLTAEQTAKLEQLIEDYWSQMRAEKIEAVRGWLQANTELTEAQEAGVIAAYDEYETGKYRVCRKLFDSPGAAEQSPHEAFSSLHEQRDRKLLEVLTEEQVEQLRSALRSGRGRRPDR